MKQLKLKMFYQTYIAHKPSPACTAVTPPAATELYRLLLHAICSARRTPYLVDDAAGFSFLSLMTLTVDL